MPGVTRMTVAGIRAELARRLNGTGSRASRCHGALLPPVVRLAAPNTYGTHWGVILPLEARTPDDDVARTIAIDMMKQYDLAD